MPNLAKSSVSASTSTSGDSADEVRLDILRFGVGRVVHVAADVEVVVVGVHDLGLGHEARVLGQLALVGEDEVDLLDVLGAQPVLVLALVRIRDRR